MILGIVMLLRGFADAIMMRLQQAIAFGDSTGYLPPHHYDQIFTAHGVIMIFFVAMPLVTGLMNYIVPLQIGARDVAFPFLNNFSFWMTTGGAALVMMSLFVGEFARTGWLAYPPLSGILHSPDAGWTTTSGPCRSRGGHLAVRREPAGDHRQDARARHVHDAHAGVHLDVAVHQRADRGGLPVLTAVLALLSMDRYVGTNFFTADFGGNPMMYVNLIWIWGHPEVYILILPAFGIFSEVVSTYCGKRLFGYASMVYATVVITVLSYLVWLHHFFTMGSGASVNSFFGITTMIISIPTGAKIFNWLFTMYRGRIRFEVPMLWTMGFIVTFVIGGMTGVLLAVPPADFVLHNSLFLIAHFHNVIIGGVLFGLMAGITYWFPKAFGYKLDPFWGKCSFWFWLVGFYFAFMPLYVLGLMGVTRRVSHFEDASLQIWFQVAAFGALLIALGIASFLIQLVVSYRRRDAARRHRRSLGRPHSGMVHVLAAARLQLRLHATRARPGRLVADEAARLPAADVRLHSDPHAENTWAGIVLAGLSVVMGFALIWHMWPLTVLSFAALIIVAIVHTFNYKRDYYVPADEVVRSEDARTRLLSNHG